MNHLDWRTISIASALATKPIPAVRIYPPVDVPGPPVDVPGPPLYAPGVAL